MWLLRQTPFGFQRAKPNSVFNMADLSGIVYHGQTRDHAAAPFSDFRLSPLPGEAVGRIAFASYRSPVIMSPTGPLPMPSNRGRKFALPAESAELVFCAWLPKTARPATGYPVVIVAHGYERVAYPQLLVHRHRLGGTGNGRGRDQCGWARLWARKARWRSRTNLE